MKLSEFDFDLPDDLIAVRPARPRTSAKLLVAQGANTHDMTVADLTQVLRAGDRLVLNDTKVIPARLFGTRTRETNSGDGIAKIEVTLLEPQADGTWGALVKPLRKVKEGEEIVFSTELRATFVGRKDTTGFLKFNLSGDDFDAALNAAGAMPLPPYIAAKRPADEQDRSDYQTIWAENSGAVAAPTASLHFEQWLLDELAAIGVSLTYVTLHVGAGTFLPVKVDDTDTHKMHAEIGEISPEVAASLNAVRANGGRIIAVGTTSLRLLESATDQAGVIQPYHDATDIFITPGYQFRAVDMLMTNFHLPRSTLFMLVSAFCGLETMQAAYNHAISSSYRFYSYGDASLLWRADLPDHLR